MSALGLSLGLLIGLSLGLLGGGGSTLTVPIFVYVLGFGPKEAIAASLAVVGVTSLFGAIGHWRAGNVNLRSAAAFGLVAMLGAYLGAHLAVRVPGGVQLALFALVMLVAAYFMFRARQPGHAAGRRGARGRVRVAWVAPAALAVGILTGLLGVGGGFLIVPALVLLGDAPMKEAVGTSLLVIAMNTAAGLTGYAGRIEIPWVETAAFTALAVAGILVGTQLVRHVSHEALRRAFAVFLVVMSVFILYQNRSVIPAFGEATGRAAAASAP